MVIIFFFPSCCLYDYDNSAQRSRLLDKIFEPLHIEFGLLDERVQHRRGRPFPKIDLDPRGWPERRRSMSVKVGVISGECSVCDESAPARAAYCPRCRELVGWGGSGVALRTEALRRAWRPEEDGFACYYTGVVLDHGGPWGVAGSTAVAAGGGRRRGSEAPADGRAVREGGSSGGGGDLELY